MNYDAATIGDGPSNSIEISSVFFAFDAIKYLYDGITFTLYSHTHTHPHTHIHL